MKLIRKFKNPMFVFQLILSFVTPMLAYAGLTFKDITSWPKLGCIIVSAFQNPYVLALVFVNVWNALYTPKNSENQLKQTGENEIE